MNETTEDLARLQALLDESYGAAGSPPPRSHHSRAKAVCQGPLHPAGGHAPVGPGDRDRGRAAAHRRGCDGVFYRGALKFGSSPESVRIRHIRQRPHVTATRPSPARSSRSRFTGGQHCWTSVRTRTPSFAGSCSACTPRYGAEWERFLDANVRDRVDADRMFTYHME